MASASGPVAEQAINLLRCRVCDPKFVHSAFKSSPDSNYNKLRFLISSTISNACSNSVLLLGPRGSGKSAVVDLVLEDLKAEHPDVITLIKLNGMLHSEDNYALKEIARQLCLEHQLSFSKTGKQRLLYSLLDAVQSLTSQAVVIGISCRLDADQLLEKRVRSRFSHRKLLFVPPSVGDTQRLIDHLLYLPKESKFSPNYIEEFNLRLKNILGDKGFKSILNSLADVDGRISDLVRFLFLVVSSIDMETGFLSMENFSCALSCLQRQTTMDNLQGLSILELYMLVCMNRLENKEKSSYNFTSVMKEYKAIHDAYKTSDNYAYATCLRAFQHLLDRELVGFTDIKSHHLSLEFRPVSMLISSQELSQSLKSNSACPAILLKLIDHERYA